MKSLFRRAPAAAATPASESGSKTRPVGEMGLFLEDVRARGFSPRGIVDVGAHKGDWTRLAAEVFPDVPVLLLEPQEELADSLTAVTADFPQAKWVKAGAGAEYGEACFTMWEDFAGSTFLPKARPEEIAAGRQRMTAIVPLDQLIAENVGFQPDLVKIDVQGFEMEVLRGASSLFGKTGLFIIECSLFTASKKRPLAREIIGRLAANGYELYDLPGYLRRPADGALGQIDLAFALADGPLRRHAGWN